MLAPACAWCAGLGLWRTLMMLALLDRFAPGGALPGVLAHLGQPPFFWLFIALGAAEATIDLLPGRDVRWDRWNAQLRILGGGALAFLATAPAGIGGQVFFALVGLFLALFTHSIHSGARIAAAKAETNRIVSPVTSITELCMIAGVILPLSDTPALTMLMMGFMILASTLVAYLVWPCVRTALLQVFGSKQVEN